MYNDQENVCEFIEAWKILQQNNKYYQAIDKIERKNTKNSDKEIEKMIDLDHVLKDKDFNNEFRDMEDCLFKDNLFDSKELTNKLDLLTMESNYCTKNKENQYLDKTA